MIKKFIEGKRQPVWYSLASVFISVILIAAAGGAYVKKTTDRAIHESERKQCALVTIIDDYFRSSPLPPAVDDAQARARKEYARAVHQQRLDFRCDEKR